MIKKTILFALLFIYTASYASTPEEIFANECEDILDLAARETIAEASTYYDELLKISDPNCNPISLAPDINESIVQSICTNIENREQYGFCKVPDLSEGETWVVQVGSVGDATADAMLQMMSVTEQIIRNGCFDDIISKDQNIFHNFASLVGVIQNYTAAASVLNPAVAAVTIGSRFAVMISSALGAVVDTVMARSRSLEPTLFSSKVCALKKYMDNRVRSNCLFGCKETISQSRENYERAICEVKDTNDQYEGLISRYQSYIDIITQINSISGSTNDTVLTPTDNELVSGVTNVLSEDRNYLSDLLGYESPIEFTDRYFDVTDPNDPRLKWLEFEQPSTTISRQKEDISLIMGIPGLIMRDHFCDNKNPSAIQSDLFQRKLNFSEQALNTTCETLKLYHECGENKNWRNSSSTKCRDERARLSNPNYNILESQNGSKIREFMLAIQMQKLTQEIKSNNAACYTPTHCEANKYNCMALLSTFGGTHNCQSLAELPSAGRDIQYLNAVKAGDYISFHKDIVDLEKEKIENNPDFQRFLNLSSVLEEITFLEQTIYTRDAYDTCMDGKYQNEMEEHCYDEYNDMRRVAMESLDRCTYKAPGSGEIGATSYSGWEDFFKSTEAEGNFVGTVKRTLSITEDPWVSVDNEGNRITRDEVELVNLSYSLCSTLYCQSIQSVDEYNNGKLFEPQTWFGADNPPFILFGKNMFSRVVKKCPEVFEKKRQQIFDDNASNLSDQLTELNRVKECLNYQCEGSEGVISQLNSRFGSNQELWNDISFDQCQ
jgi:hypothetical protein